MTSAPRRRSSARPTAFAPRSSSGAGCWRAPATSRRWSSSWRSRTTPSLPRSSRRRRRPSSATSRRERTALLFSGEYDDRNALLTISAGAGGTEATDWAEMLLRMYLRWAERHRFRTEILDRQEGEQAGLKSVIVTVDGRRAYGWLRAERGVHRLVRISPYDAQKRRQTTFALVEVLPGGRGRRRDRAGLGRDPGGHLPVPGRRGPARQQDRFGGPPDAPPDGDRGPEPERAEPDPEQGDGDQGPHGAPPGARAGGEGGRAPEAPRRARRGRLGQPDPELRPPPVPDGQGPPDRVRDVQHRRGPGRRPRRLHAGRARAPGHRGAAITGRRDASERPGRGPLPAGDGGRSPGLRDDLA